MTRVLHRFVVALLVAGSSSRVATGQSLKSFRDASQYSADRDGDAVLVFRHDSLVLDDHHNGYYESAPHGLASGTKAFTCVLAALGEADGLIRLDDPVSRRIGEFRDDSLKSRITIRQLLSLTSGLEPDLDNVDNYASAVGLPMQSQPGARFAYGAAASHVFVELMRRSLGGQDIVAYLDRRVFQPLGIAVPVWARDALGQPQLSSGAAMTPRDWGIYGLLLLHDGRWRGRQLVPAASMAQCRKGSAANPWFGLGLWLNARVPSVPAPAGVTRVGRTDRRLYAPDLPADIFLAAGTGGQRLYVIPSKDLVIVRLGHNRGPEFQDDGFLRIALSKR